MKKETIAQQLGIKKFPFIIKDDNYYYFENNKGFWTKREYDDKGNEIYYEDSDGFIINNRPKVMELSIEEIAKKLGIDSKNLKIVDK